MSLIKWMFLLSFIAITGCSTPVPIVAKFPGVPKTLIEECPKLRTIETENISIIDITKTVTENYTTYYECSTKVEGWIEWYNSQKKIFEEVSK